MTDTPSDPSDGEPDPDAGPEPEARIIVRIYPPEQSTGWTAGPLTPRAAKQSGAQISCGLNFSARRAELAARVNPPAGPRTRRTPEQILGGPMPGRRPPIAIPAVAVVVYVELANNLVMLCPEHNLPIVVAGSCSCGTPRRESLPRGALP